MEEIKIIEGQGKFKILVYKEFMYNVDKRGQTLWLTDADLDLHDSMVFSQDMN